MEKVERLPGLTAKSIVVGVLLVAITSGLFSVSAAVPHVSWFPTWTGDQGESIFFGFLLVTTVILALINSAVKIFTAQEIAVIITMYYVGCAFTLFGIPHEAVNNPIMHQFTQGLGLAISWPERLPYVNPLVWGPIRDKDTALSILWQSTWDIPWGLWAPTIAWTLLFWGSLAFMCLSVAILIRHWWTRVEGLSFPLASIEMELVNFTQKGQPSVMKGAPAKYFWLGFLISFIIYIPILHALGVLYPYIPGPAPAYLGPYKIVWTQDLAVYGFLPWVDLMIEPWPWLIAFAYLWPMDCLNGFMLGWLIYHIIFPVLFTALGWIPPMPYGTDSWTIDVQFMRDFPPQMPAWKHNVLGGSLLALIIYPMWVNRETVKKIFAGLVKPVPEMEEEKGILSLRTGWIMLIISFILSLIAWGVAGVPLWMTIIYIAFPLIFLSVGMARIAAETPGRLGGFTFHNHYGPQYAVGASLLSLSGMYWAESQEATFASTFLVDFPQDHNRVFPLCNGWIAGTLVGFKLADEAKIKVSDMAKAVIIAVVTWLIVTALSSIIWLYAWSFPEGSPGRGRIGWHGDILRNRSDPTIRSWAWIKLPSADEILGMAAAWIISAAISIAIFVLRGMLPWFAVNPIGIAAAIGWNGGDDPSWGTGAFIGWILKGLTLRLGGVKLYLERGRPLALGLFFGFTIGYFLHWTFGYLHNLGIYGNYLPV